MRRARYFRPVSALVGAAISIAAPAWGDEAVGVYPAAPPVRAKTLPTAPVGQKTLPYSPSGPAFAPPLGTPQGSGGNGLGSSQPYGSPAGVPPGGLGTGGAYPTDPGVAPDTGVGGATAPPALDELDAPGALASGLGPGREAASSSLPMIGDMAPPVSIQRKVRAFQTPNRPPPLPPPFARSLLAPSVRGFKIAENQSPVPQDRVFFNFSYFDDVNKKLNRFFEAPIEGLQIYRYVWGFEKTFNQGRGSFGLRLPLNNIYAKSTEPSLNSGGNATELGNLSIFLKHIFYQDPKSGSLASGGIAVTPRTAPRQFAGAPFLGPDNTTTLQPFFAYFLNFDRLYIHGFNSIDIPYDYRQPTLLYNDVGVGYFLFRDPEAQGLIRSIAPTVEAHANIPLNHRGEYDFLDRFGTPDIVDITAGLHVGLMQRSTLTFGFATPVTGPRPFDFEPQLLLNVYFGGSRRTRANQAPPMIGG